MKRNYFANKTKIKFGIFLKFLKKIGLLAFTLSAWSWIIGAFIWTLGTFGWFLLVYIWRKNLIVPQAVYSTAFTIIVSIGWAAVIWIFMFTWAKYHYYKYYRNNRRKLKPPLLKAPMLEWQELTLKISDIRKIIENNQILQGSNKTIFECYDYTNGKYDLISFNPIIMKRDFYSLKGELLVSQGEQVTLEVIKKIANKGMYLEFLYEISEYIPQKEKSK
ncbi:hypothetical protein JJQ93_06910 [Thermoanaerobacterium sp. R66]|nr:hypothetical protein [Thermoanaerobacterium sp. R66]